MKYILLSFIFLVSGISTISAQNSSPCQPPEIDVAIYNFVPEAKMQTGDFRPLMKSETTFVQKLRDAESFDVSDYATQILPEEIMPISCFG